LLLATAVQLLDELPLGLLDLVLRGRPEDTEDLERLVARRVNPTLS